MFDFAVQRGLDTRLLQLYLGPPYLGGQQPGEDSDGTPVIANTRTSLLVRLSVLYMHTNVVLMQLHAATGARLGLHTVAPLCLSSVFIHLGFAPVARRSHGCRT